MGSDRSDAELAKMNLEIRNMPRARSLLARAVAAKASFIDSSGHADRNSVFTGGPKNDSNETGERGVQQNEIVDWLTRPGGCCTVRSASDRGPSRVNKKM
jgi:hypothetical protein